MKGVIDVTKPVCSLVGIEGNVYALIGHVCAALEDACLYDEAEEFVRLALDTRTYDEAVALSRAFVDFG